MRTLAEPIENYIPIDRRKGKGTLNDALHRPTRDEPRIVGQPAILQESPAALADMQAQLPMGNQAGYGQIRGQQNPMGQGQGLAGGDPRMGIIQANIQGHIIPPEGSDRERSSAMGQMRGLGNQFGGGQGLKLQPAPSDPQRPSAGQPVGVTASQLDDARRSGYMTGGKTMSSMIREGLLAGMRGM